MNIIHKLILFTTIISFMGVGTLLGISSIITQIVLPIFLMLTLFLTKNKFYFLKNIYINIYLFLLAWSIIILPIAKNYDVAFNEITRIAGIYICLIIVTTLIKEKPIINITWILKTYILGYYVLLLALYIKTSFNVNINSVWLDRSKDFLGLNANTYSYMAYFSLISCYYLKSITGNYFYSRLSVITSIIAIYISFFTASRSGLIFVLLINFIYWIFINHSTTFKKSLFPVLLSMIIMIYSVNYLYNNYKESYLGIRIINSFEKEDSRITLAKNGIMLFLKHPVTGVGPGQFITYNNKDRMSHNSYTEISANYGIIGVFLLCILFLNPTKTEILFMTRSIKINEVSKISILFLFTFILYNLFYVFILTTYGMMFFITAIMIQSITHKGLFNTHNIKQNIASHIKQTL